jgi:hypothetical protein
MMHAHTINADVADSRNSPYTTSTYAESPPPQAPDQLHLEAVTSLHRFDQFTPDEQRQDLVQRLGALTGQGFPVNHSPFALHSQAARDLSSDGNQRGFRCMMYTP